MCRCHCPRRANAKAASNIFAAAALWENVANGNGEGAAKENNWKSKGKEAEAVVVLLLALTGQES